MQLKCKFTLTVTGSMVLLYGFLFENLCFETLHSNYKLLTCKNLLSAEDKVPPQ